MSGARGLALRAAASLAAVAALVGLSLARLARVPRARFVVEARAAGVEAGAVWLGPQRLGVSVRCGGRELWSRPGAGALAVTGRPDRVEVRFRREAVVIRPSDCAIGR